MFHMAARKCVLCDNKVKPKIVVKFEGNESEGVQNGGSWLACKLPVRQDWLALQRQ